ncbi:M23 family metallopeptidase [bacterium]|nr:M23 family metallopeptidase [bacterium]
MRRCLFFIFLGCILFGVLSGCLHASDGYVWPLEKRFGFSGTFGEYRGSWLHSGIDLKTGGVTGLKVLAIGDGVIYRLSVKYRGFGNTLYIRHPDGLISVYAHLKSFENKTLGLEDIVAKRRKDTGERYPGNIFIEIPVKKGQLIAYSGESGLGFPHLHLEIRRGEARPINPMSVLRQRDRSAPVIKRFILSPLGPDSLVDGTHNDVNVWLKDGARDENRSKSVPVVSGRFLVLLNTFDTISAGNQCGVHRIELRLDRKLIYSMRLDELEYGKDNHRAGLVYDHQYAHFRPMSYVYNLHNRYDAQKPGEVSCQDKGILDFSERRGLHMLMVKVWDDAGNMSSARIEIKSEAQRDEETRPPEWLIELNALRPQPLLVEAFDDFVRIWSQVPKPGPNRYSVPASAKIVAKWSDGERLSLLPASTSREWLSFLLPSREKVEGQIDLQITSGESGAKSSHHPNRLVFAVPKRGGVLETNDMKIEFPSGSLYKDQVFAIHKMNAKQTPGLPIVYGVVNKFAPEGIPLERKVTVSFICPDDLPDRDMARCGVYEYNPKKRTWSYKDNQSAGPRTVAADVRYLSVFGLLVDKVTPRIKLQRPKDRDSLKGGSNRLVVKISDVGSGIDYRKTTATIDGVPIDVEYDPDRLTLKGWFNLRRLEGKHVISIIATDKAGNKKELKRTF